MTYLGESEESGHALSGIEVRGSGNALRLYFERKSHLLWKSHVQFADRDAVGPSEIDQEYEDYRPVEGVMIPFKRWQYFDGKLSNCIVIDKIQIIRNFDLKRFENP